MKVELLWLQVVPQQQCNRHCLCDCPSTAVETAIAQCTSHWAMARGHRLNTSIVLAAVNTISGLFRAVPAVEPSLFCPLPPLSPYLISILASVDVKQHVRRRHKKLQSPGEIKRREMSWTLMKKLDAFAGPGEIKRRDVVPDPQVSPEEIKSREVELGLRAGLLSLQLLSLIHI